MSTAFVQHPVLRLGFLSTLHSAHPELLSVITCALISFFPASLKARDLYPLSREANILKKAAMARLFPVRKMIPDIVIDLKYASSDNITNRSLYPKDMPCLLHRMTLARLKRAQKTLRRQGLRLKIWDAYRPPEAHLILWKSSRASNYIVPPEMGPSLHSYGVAVDVTLVDREGRQLIMPTDHDEFSPAAASEYTGNNSTIRRNLDILQKAMKKAGFSTIKDEWWHFTNMEPQAARIIDAKRLGIQLPSSRIALESKPPSKP